MKKNQFISRACPLCGQTSPLKTLVSTRLRAEKLDYNTLVPYWNGFFKDRVFFSYARCNGCGLLFAPTFFNNAQLEQLYGQMPPNMDEVPMEALRRTQLGYFKLLKDCADLSGGFIEIGPDVGIFTENCVREGKFNEYWLFEPNRKVLPDLRKIVESKKAHIIHDMNGFSSIPDFSASTAVMIHVLDHLLDPVATLRDLRQKLKPNATLLLVTHDESSLLRCLVGWRWPAYCLQHPQIYNPETIQTLLDTAGYRTVRQRKTLNFFQINFLLRHLLWVFGIKVKSLSRLGNITIGLKLGNILTIATPKRDNK